MVARRYRLGFALSSSCRLRQRAAGSRADTGGAGTRAESSSEARPHKRLPG